MARLTVEDCLQHVENRFELVTLAARRARQIANGQPALVTGDNDKPTVLALREIAAGLVTRESFDRQEREAVPDDERLMAELAAELASAEVMRTVADAGHVDEDEDEHEHASPKLTGSSDGDEADPDAAGEGNET